MYDSAHDWTPVELPDDHLSLFSENGETNADGYASDFYLDRDAANEIIPFLAAVRCYRKQLEKKPPEWVCYAAGAVMAASDAATWLWEERSWFRSQLRNYMLSRKLEKIDVRINGKHIHVRLTPTTDFYCECHPTTIAACPETMARVLAGLPITPRVVNDYALRVYYPTY
jgi:hypothetical protein